MDYHWSINIAYFVDILYFHLRSIEIVINNRSVDRGSSVTLDGKRIWIGNRMLRLVVASLVLNGLIIIQIFWINCIQIIICTCVLKVRVVLWHLLYRVVFSSYIVFRLIVYVFGVVVLVDFQRTTIQIWGRLHFIFKISV